MRIVLDTNILVSALLAPNGPPGRLLAAVKRGDVTLVTSDVQIEELRRVLGRDRLQSRIRPQEAADLLDNLPAVGAVVTDLPAVHLSPDPADDLILAAAISGRANLIVSGDRSHVLALGQVEGVPIVTARDALDRLPVTPWSAG